MSTATLTHSVVRHRFALPQGAIHVWTAPLNAPDATLGRLAEVLSTDECARAIRYRFEHDRRRSLIRRGVLRCLLASYLGAPPAELRFEYGTHGKPRLAAPFDCGGIRFNLSDSEDLAVYAVLRGQEVG